VTDLRLPDVERLVSSYLRSSAKVAGVVADRVYTAFPAQASGEPLVLVQRIGGTPPLSHPLVVDEAQLQVDVYGGTKAAAWVVLAAVLAALDELEGAVLPEGYVSAVRQGAIRWQPDETFDPWRPRYVADVTLTTRATAMPARTRKPELGAVGRVAAAPT
jgi:Protein of unknown function (DUF3168)